MSLKTTLIQASATEIFTAQSTGPKGQSIINMISLMNQDTGDQTVTVHLCPAYAAASATNKAFTITIPTLDTYVFTPPFTLGNKDVIRAVADDADKVSAVVSYQDE
jgi:hypothetical protein